MANGKVDVAVVWGPLAGYFGDRATHKLRLTPVSPPMDGPQWPMVFDIAMGFRRGEPALKAQIDRALARNHRAIDAVLASYHVPTWHAPRASVQPEASEAPRVAAHAD